ncbi:hypothetical protein [Actinopolyspora mortivallis]|uniref:Uncharacterized protein n=1 Tax=Actinopolyspora mortivallis TaxID=33906 RepID=A0A2T0GSL1_ACTMO|nr:hypothetical protein [Actinopolyspora mortivallis]PRW62089.1 hypothetical protein CEP50_17290 [Actinopolyspora mortivallis]
MVSYERPEPEEPVGSAPRSEDHRDASGEFGGHSHGRMWCRDVNHTPRSLEVLVNRDRVVLAGPPGATAALTTDRAGRLSSALRFAADQARK